MLHSFCFGFSVFQESKMRYPVDFTQELEDKFAISIITIEVYIKVKCRKKMSKV